MTIIARKEFNKEFASNDDNNKKLTKPRGPSFGARAAAEPCSPPTDFMITKEKGEEPLINCHEMIQSGREYMRFDEDTRERAIKVSK